MNRHQHIWLVVMTTIALGILNSFLVNHFYFSGGEELISWLVLGGFIVGFTKLTFKKWVKE